MTTVRLTDDAIDQLDALPRVIKVRVDALLARLEQWPVVSGAKPLRGDRVGYYRLRTGDYRLLFQVEQAKRAVRVERVVKKRTVIEEREEVDYTVIVERIGHRSTFYED